LHFNSKGWQNHLKGYNTDAFGFAESLKPLLEKHHKKALIFGDGGAAKAVKYVLNQLKDSFLVVSRNPGAQCHRIYFDYQKNYWLQYHLIN
jgi:shikimate dehydrogenase